MEVVLEFAFPGCFREEIVSSIQPNDSIFQITFTFVLDSSDLERGWRGRKDVLNG